MGRFTVLVTDFAWPSLEIEREILARVDADLLVAETGDAEELTALAPRDAILTERSGSRPRRFGHSTPLWSYPASGSASTTSRSSVQPNSASSSQTCQRSASTRSPTTRWRLLACSRRRPSPTPSVGAHGASTRRADDTLRGQTLGIVGFGAIARSLVPQGGRVRARCSPHRGSTQRACPQASKEPQPSTSFS